MWKIPKNETTDRPKKKQVEASTTKDVQCSFDGTENGKSTSTFTVKKKRIEKNL